MKKLTILLVSIFVLLLTGCASNDADVNSANSDVKDNSEKTTIRMITWTNDSTIDALNKINDMYLEETGVRVELVDVDSPDYDEFLKSEIESNNVDIFCYTTDSKAFAQPVVDWAPSEMLTWEAIIKNGYALDLSDYNFIKNWSTGAEACRYEDGIYGIATGMTIMNGLFYNKKVFSEHGWREPKSWDEFVKLCDDIRAEGLEPITVGGKDRWPVQMLTNAIVDSVVEGAGEDFSEGLWKGTHTYTDEKSMEIYNREKTILSYFEPDFLDVSYEECPKRFTEGAAVMFYSGSWNAADIEAADPKFEYDYFAIPGDSRNNFTGKYDLTIGINAKSSNEEEAVKWLEYFSKPDVYKVYIDTNGFIPTMSWVSSSNNFLLKINDRLSDADRSYECYSRSPSTEDFYGTFDIINFEEAGGKFSSSEEYAQAAQEAWDEAVEKLKSK